MRKFLNTYLPVSLLLAFLAIVVLSCGGGGGGDGGETQVAPPAVTFPWQPNMMSGFTTFEENIDTEGVYHSYLYKFNSDSFLRYGYENPPDTSDSVTGSWSIDADGKLILSIPGQGTITVTLLNDA